jgi:type VI secretion system protein ImpG
MAIACMFPGHGSGHGGEGFVVPRGTPFTAKTPVGEDTLCGFRSSQDVTLWPLEIIMARWTGVPPDMPGLDQFLTPDMQVKSALRLRLRTTNDIPVSALQGLDRLPVYLAGDGRTASHLFELVHAAGVATVTGAPGEFATRPYHVVTQDAVEHEGLAPEQSVLPAVPRKFHGHNLVQEFFAYEPRFWFFALTDLARGLAAVEGHEVEIVILLDRPLDTSWAERVNASDFMLFCTPLVNLLPLTTARVRIDPAQPEHLIVPMPDMPLDYEVHSVALARCQVSENSGDLLFRPAHAARRYDEDDEGRYFAVRRERHIDSTRQHGTLRTFTGTRTFVLLVDERGEPNADGIEYLSVDAWVTNRDLPGLLRPNGRDDLEVDRTHPVARVGLVRAPSQPRPPLAHGAKAWQLYGQLNLDYTLLDDRHHEPAPGEGVRSRLRLFLDATAAACSRQVESLVSALGQPVNDFIPGQSGMLGRGIECVLSFDESGFDGMSPYTLALALEHYVARHVSAHSFTRTVLRSKQRGTIRTWPPRPGTREVF